MSKFVTKIVSVMLILLAAVFVLFIAEVSYLNRNNGKVETVELKPVVIEEVQPK